VNQVPHVKIILAFCAFGLGGYALLSLWVVLVSKDATLLGDVIGTWKSFAVAAFTFWVGSSLGGKSKDGPTGKPNDPVSVKETEPQP
jgi:hypothetical protein